MVNTPVSHSALIFKRGKVSGRQSSCWEPNITVIMREMKNKEMSVMQVSGDG